MRLLDHSFHVLDQIEFETQAHCYHLVEEGILNQIALNSYHSILFDS